MSDAQLERIEDKIDAILKCLMQQKKGNGNKKPEKKKVDRLQRLKDFQKEMFGGF